MTVDVRAVASLFGHHHSVAALAQAGLIAGGSEREREALAAVFAGEPAWMTDSFLILRPTDDDPPPNPQGSRVACPEGRPYRQIRWWFRHGLRDGRYLGEPPPLSPSEMAIESTWASQSIIAATSCGDSTRARSTRSRPSKRSPGHSSRSARTPTSYDRRCLPNWVVEAPVFLMTTPLATGARPESANAHSATYATTLLETGSVLAARVSDEHGVIAASGTGRPDRTLRRLRSNRDTREPSAPRAVRSRVMRILSAAAVDRGARQKGYSLRRPTVSLSTRPFSGQCTHPSPPR